MVVQETVKNLIERKITIATAESITGGYISKLLTDEPGSSTILKESFVVYSDEAKVDILGVDADIIKKHGVVSEEVATEMCKKLYDKTKRDICVSTTGNAGPTVCDDKPIGRVYVGICVKGVPKAFEFNFTGQREDIRRKTCIETFRILYSIFQ